MHTQNTHTHAHAHGTTSTTEEATRARRRGTGCTESLDGETLQISQILGRSPPPPRVLCSLLCRPCRPIDPTGQRLTHCRVAEEHTDERCTCERASERESVVTSSDGGGALRHVLHERTQRVQEFGLESRFQQHDVDVHLQTHTHNVTSRS